MIYLCLVSLVSLVMSSVFSASFLDHSKIGKPLGTCPFMWQGTGDASPTSAESTAFRSDSSEASPKETQRDTERHIDFVGFSGNCLWRFWHFEGEVERHSTGIWRHVCGHNIFPNEYAHMHAGIHTCRHTYMHTHTYIHTHTHIIVPSHTTCINLDKVTCMDIHTVYLHTDTYADIHIHTMTYTYTAHIHCTHTHKHTHTHIYIYMHIYTSTHYIFTYIRT